MCVWIERKWETEIKRDLKEEEKQREGETLVRFVRVH